MVKYESKYDIPSKIGEVKLELDIFGKKSHKIIMSSLVKGNKLENGFKLHSEVTMVSKGFDLDLKAAETISMQPQDMSYNAKLQYHLEKTKSESEILAKLNMKEAELLMKLFSKDLLHIDSKLQLSKQNQIADTTISAYALKPLVSHFEIKDLNTLIYTLAKQDTPKNKLQISSGLVLGQIADFRAEIIKGSNKNDLIHASVKLDDANFMKPDFGINIENIQKLLFVSISNLFLFLYLTFGPSMNLK